MSEQVLDCHLFEQTDFIGTLSHLLLELLAIEVVNYCAVHMLDGLAPYAV
jgi:hypothetical protein